MFVVAVHTLTLLVIFAKQADSSRTLQPGVEATEKGHIAAFHPGSKSSKMIALIVIIVIAHIYFFLNLFCCLVYETGPFWNLKEQILAAARNDYQTIS